VSFEERPQSLFQPDILAPYEFAEQLQSGEQPEQRLMMAVLGDAFFCFQKYHLAPNREGQKIFSDAEGWILDDSEQWPFSFANICHNLGISPGYVRLTLARWKDNHDRQVRNSRAGMKLRRGT